jgi:threonyl-tRNA synthetase
MPQRFDLKYTDKDGNEKYVVVQHRAPLGSSERFVGFLLEHFAGAFPTWLAPVQIEMIPIGEKHQEYAEQVAKTFREKGLRIDVDSRNETMQAKIRDAQGQKIPYMFIMGDREAQEGTVSVRLRSGENLGAKPVAEVLEHINSIYLTKSLKLW